MYASYLDLHLEIDSEWCLRTKIYDKSDNLNVLIVKIPFICSNIPAAPVYGIYISQLILYSRACGSYQDFLDRGQLLTRKLLNQRLLLVKLTTSLRKFYGRHHDLVDRYGIFVSQMTTVITYHRVWKQINTTGATSGAGTAYHSGAHEFTPSFQWGSFYSIFSFMCMLCRSLFVLLYFFCWPLCCLFFFDMLNYSEFLIGLGWVIHISNDNTKQIFYF